MCNKKVKPHMLQTANRQVKLNKKLFTQKSKRVK